jgi:3-dehydroquinate synthetase
MKTLINYYHQTAPIADDMTEASLTYVGMAIALGMTADPDYRYELQGFNDDEVRKIKKNVKGRFANLKTPHFEAEITKNA